MARLINVQATQARASESTRLSSLFCLYCTYSGEKRKLEKPRTAETGLEPPSEATKSLDSGFTHFFFSHLIFFSTILGKCLGFTGRPGRAGHPSGLCGMRVVPDSHAICLPPFLFQMLWEGLSDSWLGGPWSLSREPGGSGGLDRPGGWTQVPHAHSRPVSQPPF